MTGLQIELEQGSKERFGSHGILFNSFLSQKEKLFAFAYFKVSMISLKEFAFGQELRYRMAKRKT